MDTCPFHQDCMDKSDKQSTKITMLEEGHKYVTEKIDSGIEWMKWLIGLFIVQIVMTLGGGIWFWASDHSQQLEMYREIREMRPRVDELWFKKTSYYPLQQGEVQREN